MLRAPWHPRPLNELDELCAASEYLRSKPVLIAFDASPRVLAEMEPLAEASIAADKAQGGVQGLYWCWAGQHKLVDHVRALAQIPARAKLVVLDVAGGMVYVCPEVSRLDGGTINAFAQAYRAGSLEGSYFGATGL